MASPKLLIGGVVTVGSVSTAAVVAHQQGFFSLPGIQTQSSDNTDNLNAPAASQVGQENTDSADRTSGQQTVDTTPSTTPSKPKQEAVEQWLKTKSGAENLTIKIQKNSEPKGFKETEITENDLDQLSDYLTANTDLLKSFISSLETKSLTFDKSSGIWKLVLTKEDIKKWVDKTSGNKATLKLVDENGAKDLTGTEDLNKLLGDLFKGKSAFEKITLSSSETKKNILFEKVESDWKHIKQAIKEWLESSKGGKRKLKVQVKKGISTLYWDDQGWKEEDLIGLLKHLKASGTSYVPGDGQSTSTVKLQKKKDSTSHEWEQVTNPSRASGQKGS